MALFDPPIPRVGLRDEVAKRGIDQLSDARLVGEVAAVLARPRAGEADSFVLHAPLELAARAALLPHVAPEHRALARLRLVALAAEYEASGDPALEPPPEKFGSTRSAALHLGDAIDRGDLVDVDIAARWLGRAASSAQLRSLLTDEVVPRLSAAAHAPIFLYHLPRVAPRGEISGELLRGLAREMARNPDWRLHWIEEPRTRAPNTSEALFDAIAATPSVGDRTSFFIHPVMSLVDAPEVGAASVAGDVLRNVTAGSGIADRGRMLLRIAALSMLEEPPMHAPYGWSHCLTMPQAVLGIADSCADPSEALAVAATYVVGFRAAMADRPLVAEFAPDDPGVDPAEALGIDATTAAASVHHAATEQVPGIITELATRASVQRDAHLVKYALACFDAGHDDRAHRRLFLAAAASLVGWWAEAGDPDDPLEREG